LLSLGSLTIYGRGVSRLLGIRFGNEWFSWWVQRFIRGTWCFGT